MLGIKETLKSKSNSWLKEYLHPKDLIKHKLKAEGICFIAAYKKVVYLGTELPLLNDERITKFNYFYATN